MACFHSLGNVDVLSDKLNRKDKEFAKNGAHSLRNRLVRYVSDVLWWLGKRCSRRKTVSEEIGGKSKDGGSARSG